MNHCHLRGLSSLSGESIKSFFCSLCLIVTYSTMTHEFVFQSPRQQPFGIGLLIPWRWTLQRKITAISERRNKNRSREFWYYCDSSSLYCGSRPVFGPCGWLTLSSPIFIWGLEWKFHAGCLQCLELAHCASWNKHCSSPPRKYRNRNFEKWLKMSFRISPGGRKVICMYFPLATFSPNESYQFPLI